MNRQGRSNDVEEGGETAEGTNRDDITMLRQIEKRTKEQTGPTEWCLSRWRDRRTTGWRGRVGELKIAQWLERRTRDRKITGSCPGRSGGKIYFFSSVSLL